MRYLLRPDAGQWTVYCAPAGMDVLSRPTKEEALRESTALNSAIESWWSAGRESERIERRWGRVRGLAQE